MLDPEIVESAIADALIELQPSADALATARAALAVDLRRVAEEQRRYAAAIAAAGDVPVLGARPSNAKINGFRDHSARFS